MSMKWSITSESSKYHTSCRAAYNSVRMAGGENNANTKQLRTFPRLSIGLKSGEKQKQLQQCIIPQWFLGPHPNTGQSIMNKEYLLLVEVALRAYQWRKKLGRESISPEHMRQDNLDSKKLGFFLHSTCKGCQVIYSQFGLAIHQNDHQARRRFVEWAQNEIAVVPDFHKRILFSDEAHFWLNGYVNKQNCRIWSEANPQVYVETPLHPEKLTVWCALWAGGILLQKR
ncbi:hypothetical protein TNCV_754351 [Trichonephila clavipes]|nr:hypothetical protein TNCV_754351 [Trichonephila clavipes]